MARLAAKGKTSGVSEIDERPGEAMAFVGYRGGEGGTKIRIERA